MKNIDRNYLVEAMANVVSLFDGEKKSAEDILEQLSVELGDETIFTDAMKTFE